MFRPCLGGWSAGLEKCCIATDATVPQGLNQCVMSIAFGYISACSLGSACLRAVVTRTIFVLALALTLGVVQNKYLVVLVLHLAYSLFLPLSRSHTAFSKNS